VFKVLRLDRSTFYLTPVYRNAWQPEDAEMRYVADQPSWIGGGSRLSAYYYAHIADLAGQRGRVAVELVRRPWQFMVYYEPVLGAAAEVYAHSSPERLKALYSEVDSTIANLLRLAGPRTVVVLVGSGSEGMGAAAKDKGFFFLSGLPGSTLSMPVSPYDITPTLDHLLGVETPAAGRRGKPMGEVLNRSWDYEAWRLMAPAYDPNDVLGLDAGSLAEIGALSDRIVYP
jgi:hypothetical protein